MSISINKNELIDFISLLQLSGNFENNEILLNVSETQMKAIAVDTNKTMAFRGVLNGKFEKWDNIGIDNLKLMKEFLKTFGTEDVVISKVKNKLEITSPTKKLTTKCILRNPQYIINILSEEKFNELVNKCDKNVYGITQDIVSQIVSYASKLKNGDIILKGENGILSISREDNENEVVAQFDLAKGEAFEIKVNGNFLEILKTINSDISISLKNNTPIYLKSINTNYTLEYIVAPLKTPEKAPTA